MNRQRRNVTITLTPDELTDIRVSILCRLDLLGKPRDSDTDDDAADRRTRYARIKALMDEGGVLHRAMIESLAREVV